MADGIPSTPGSAGGASGSLSFGDATQMREEMRSATEGPSGQEGAPAPQQGPPQGAPAPPSAPDAQPPSNSPFQPSAAQGQPSVAGMFAPNKVGNKPDPNWRQTLYMWSQHPQAGPALRYLGYLATRDGHLKVGDQSNRS